MIKKKNMFIALFSSSIIVLLIVIIASRPSQPLSIPEGMPDEGFGSDFHVEIPIYTTGWGIIQSVSESIRLDGITDELAWESATKPGPFVTFHQNALEKQPTQMKLLHDGTHLYLAIRGEQAAQPDHVELEWVDIVLRLDEAANDYYVFSLPIRGDDGLRGTARYGEGSAKRVNLVQYELQQSERDWSAEVRLPFHELGINQAQPGQLLQMNVVRYQLHAQDASSLIPVKTSYVTSSSNPNHLEVHTFLVPEGRFASFYMDEPPLAEMQLEDIRLLYLDYQKKQIVFKTAQSVSLDKNDYHLEWISPIGNRTPLLDFSVSELTKNEVFLAFSHPPIKEIGLYKLQLSVKKQDQYESDAMTIIAFDREDIIAAGEQEVNGWLTPDLRPDDPSQYRQLSPRAPTVLIQRLLGLIPEQPGVRHVGVPEFPDLHPHALYTWNSLRPGQLQTSKSTWTYPNNEDASFPYREDKSMTVWNRLGEAVEYPYYEEPESGRRFFLSAHLWYHQRIYVIGEAKNLAFRDPLGTARLLYRFMEVYQGYVPVQDYPWNTRPLSWSVGSPPPYFGGMWYPWYFADLFYVADLSNTYALLKRTNAFELLAEEIEQQTGQPTDVRQEIYEKLFKPSVDYIRSYLVRNTNMDIDVWNGMTAIGRVFGIPDYIHDVVERMTNNISNGFLFDGFWKEPTLSYHQQMVYGLSSAISKLKGWSDPDGYVSQRDGLTFRELDMNERISVLRRANEVMQQIVYPDGHYLPIGDTSAVDRSLDPIDIGSFLLPATGVARLSSGGSTALPASFIRANPVQQQVYLTFTPDYGHHHLDPLNLILFAWGQELLPDIGYTHTKYSAWTRSTLAHNTVVVDAKDKGSTHGGDIELFIPDANSIVQLVEARQERPNESSDLYRRQLWQISFPEEGSGGYVLDLFRVRGGERHEYTLNGDANRNARFITDIPLSDYGLYLLPEGTPVRHPETEVDTGSAGKEYYAYMYVRNVLHAALNREDFKVTLETEVSPETGETGAGLNIIGLLEDGSYDLFLGESPSLLMTRLHGEAKDTNDLADEYMLPKLVLRREGKQLDSRFITAIEPFAAGASGRITSIQLLALDQGDDHSVAVAVQYGNITDIILSAPQYSAVPLQTDDITLHGKAGFIRLVDGKIRYMKLIGGTELRKGDAVITSTASIAGKVEAVKRTVKGDPFDAFVTKIDWTNMEETNWAGRYVIIEHPDRTKHGYPIAEVLRMDHGETWICLDNMDPGFEIFANHFSQMSFYPGLSWNGEHQFIIESEASMYYP